MRITLGQHTSSKTHGWNRKKVMEVWFRWRLFFSKFKGVLRWCSLFMRTFCVTSECHPVDLMSGILHLMKSIDPNASNGISKQPFVYGWLVKHHETPMFIYFSVVQVMFWSQPTKYRTVLIRGCFWGTWFSLTMKHPIDHPESIQVQDVQQIRKYKSLG